jgi:hypothetical protein
MRQFSRTLPFVAKLSRAASGARHHMASLVAWATIAATNPLGCGGVQEEPLHARHEPAPHTRTEPTPSVEVPEGTVREMKACVDARAGQWAESYYAFQYNMTTNQRGTVLELSCGMQH